MITLSIIFFIIGILFLLFGKFENAVNDIIGFMLVIAAYVILLFKVYELQQL
jgi:hypothetical protein